MHAEGLFLRMCVIMHVCNTCTFVSRGCMLHVVHQNKIHAKIRYMHHFWRTFFCEDVPPFVSRRWMWYILHTKIKHMPKYVGGCFFCEDVCDVCTLFSEDECYILYKPKKITCQNTPYESFLEDVFFERMYETNVRLFPKMNVMNIRYLNKLHTNI